MRPHPLGPAAAALTLAAGLAAAAATSLAAARPAGEPPRRLSLTYCRQVAPIVQRRCEGCHRAEGAAPFPLDRYEQVKNRAATIRAMVASRRMPPWHADPRYGKFLNDRSLTAAERETLLTWLDRGCPLGDPEDLPPPTTYPKEWSIGQPDVVVRMAQEFVVPAEGVLDYQRFVVDPGFKEDVWVERAQAKPGCRAVHHILVYVQQPGRPLYDILGNTPVICGTAPGDMPLILPPGMAKKIPAGSKLLFEVHYTPNGKVERDRSALALIFAKKPPEREVKMNILAKPSIRIPAGDRNHREEQAFTFPGSIRILSLMPHMHLRGKSWEYRILYADGRSETILSVPNYDFNWQSVYRFADPPRLPKGAKLLCIARWDNSRDNPANPDPTKEVTYGLQTSDEMMNGWMDYVEEAVPL
jgi:hypothetical protein